MKKKIEIGNKFGRLEVIKYVGQNKWKDSLWECQCECGKIKIICGNSLKRKKSQSCGCLQKEKVKEKMVNNQFALKHGLRKHPLYTVWYNIIERCTNINNKNYKYYGGREIKVCDEWINNPKAFIEYCLNLKKDPWKDGLEIDRIDNDGNYRIGNIRFTTKQENLKNKRKKYNK